MYVRLVSVLVHCYTHARGQATATERRTLAMDGDRPASKRPCVRQTTLFGTAVVDSFADIYKNPTTDYDYFVNAFAHCDGKMRNQADLKRATDEVWKMASREKRRQLLMIAERHWHRLQLSPLPTTGLHVALAKKYSH